MKCVDSFTLFDKSHVDHQSIDLDKLHLKRLCSPLESARYQLATDNTSFTSCFSKLRLARTTFQLIQNRLWRNKGGSLVELAELREEQTDNTHRSHHYSRGFLALNETWRLKSTNDDGEPWSSATYSTVLDGLQHRVILWRWNLQVASNFSFSILHIKMMIDRSGLLDLRRLHRTI